MEYDWRPDGGYVRARLAVVHIHRVIEFHPPMSRRSDEIYEGDENGWRLRWRVVWPEPVEEMQRQFANLAREAGWRPAAGAEPVDWNGSRWGFRGRDGAAWGAEVSIGPDAEGRILLDVTVTRESPGK